MCNFCFSELHPLRDALRCRVLALAWPKPARLGDASTGEHQQQQQRRRRRRRRQQLRLRFSRVQVMQVQGQKLCINYNYFCICLTRRNSNHSKNNEKTMRSTFGGLTANSSGKDEKCKRRQTGKCSFWTC